jgi:hypothetical protein
VTKIAVPAPFAVSTEIGAEPDVLDNAIMVLWLGRLCVLGLALDFALNLKKTSLNDCRTVLCVGLFCDFFGYPLFLTLHRTTV